MSRLDLTLPFVSACLLFLASWLALWWWMGTPQWAEWGVHGFILMLLVQNGAPAAAAAWGMAALAPQKGRAGVFGWSILASLVGLAASISISGLAWAESEGLGGLFLLLVFISSVLGVPAILVGAYGVAWGSRRTAPPARPPR